MVKINRIANSLIGINDAAFQELCNKFLRYKYGFKSIIQTGSVIGKEKTRKGTPDTIFIDKLDLLVFVECTTQTRVGKSKSFFNKIQNDILKCFDTSKTKTNKNKISKIIYCHLEKLEVNEIEHFAKLCFDNNPNCKFEQYGIDDLSLELESYPSLLKTYLDINIDSGQLLNLVEYIQFYEKPELKLSTPISNIFYGRENEKIEGMKKLNECNLLLITGSSGVGKTRFAIELCELFQNANNSYSIVCLANNGNNVYEDLQTHLVANRDYIIIVDDANRAMANFSFILYLLKQQRKGKVKIVVTVRDYAVDLIEKISFDYNYETINLTKVTDDEITSILKSDSFNIQNDAYLEKIIKISTGNLRIAIMCAMLAIKEQNINTLNNISQLYEQYFGEIYSKIAEEQEELSLKVLGIISFFRVISKERADVNERIFSVFKISEVDFWNQCQILNKKEIVDLYENEVVKISDQILSTYIFYKAFFDLKKLDFSLLIRNFIEFESNFYDSLNPLLSAYDYKNIKELLADSIEFDRELIIDNQDLNQVFKIISIFWFCIEKKTLNYIYKYISNLPNPEVIEFTADYDHNHVVKNREVDALSVLNKFRYSVNENSKIALELMFLFVEKVPYQSDRLSYFIKENWLIIRNDYYNDFQCQHLLVDFIIEKVKMDPSPLYKVFFYKIASYLLELRYEEHNSSGKHFTFYTIQIQLNDSIKKLRTNIWEFAWTLYEEDPNKFYKLIFDLKYEQYEGSKKLWTFDSKLVLPMLQTLNYNELNACEALEQYLEYLNWAKVKYDKTIKTKATNKLYLLKKNLTNKDRSRVSTISDRKTAIYKRLSKICSNFTHEDYIQFFNDVESINSKTLQSVDLSFSLTVVFEDLAIKNKHLFINVLEYFLNNYTLQVWSIRILNIYFNSKPQNCDDLFFSLQKLKSKRKDNWLSEFHVTILKEFITKDKQYYLQNFYDLLLKSDATFYRISNIIEKYSAFESVRTIYSKTLDILIKNTKIRVDEQFIENALNLTRAFEKCETIYLRHKLKDRMFDYDHATFQILLKNDSTFIIRYLNNIPKGMDSEYNYSSDRISIIWDMENHEEIVLLVIDYFNSEKYWYHSKDLLSALFIGLNEVQSDNAMSFIENVIRKEYANTKYMKTIFKVITHSYVLKKVDFLKLFLSFNQDFVSFKELELFPGSMGTSGSWIPVFQKRIDDWEKIYIAVQSMNMGVKLLNHLEYIEEMIDGYKRRIKFESKREFMENI